MPASWTTGCLLLRRSEVHASAKHCAFLGVPNYEWRAAALDPATCCAAIRRTTRSLPCCPPQVRRLRRLDVEHLAVAEYVVESGERNDCHLTPHVALDRMVPPITLTQQLISISCAAANDSVIMEAASTQLGQVRALAPVLTPAAQAVRWLLSGRAGPCPDCIEGLMRGRCTAADAAAPQPQLGRPAAWPHLWHLLRDSAFVLHRQPRGVFDGALLLCNDPIAHTASERSCLWFEA